MAGMGKMNRKAQSSIEYALLFAIVTAAFIAMQYYVNRCIQGRLKQIQDEVNDPVVDQDGNPLY